MSESNWTLGDQGTQIYEVSQEASQVGSAATNLLVDKEDQLWITGDAPQHVVLKLSSNHPPLWYAGWHVWHDYLTNPKTVEISSGPSSSLLTALLVCEALPGAGTQVWRLPQCIPAEHTFVRFKVMETFAPGPTYINNLVLLSRDPGPRYRSSESYPRSAQQQRGPSSPAIADFGQYAGRGGSNSSVPDYGGKQSKGGSVATIDHTNGSVGTASYRKLEPDLVASRPMETPVRSNADSQVGVYMRGETTYSTNPSNNRMSDLLKGLDEDIRSLKPIKTVSPSKNMLIYVPQETPQLDLGLDDLEDGEGPETGSDDADERSPSVKRRSKNKKNASPKRVTKDHKKKPLSDDELRLREAPVPIIQYVAPVLGSGPYPCVSSTFEGRLSTLEQAVASLSQSVQHQREDLIMIKRLLLQQAADRRNEQERNIKKAMSQPNQPPTAAPAAFMGGEYPSNPAVRYPWSKQQVSVEFPEDALRSFVEKVMEEKLRKIVKREEKKANERSKAQFDQLLQEMCSMIDERVRSWQQLSQNSNPPPVAAQTSRGPLSPGSVFSVLHGNSSLGSPSGANAVHPNRGYPYTNGNNHYNSNHGHVTSTMLSSNGARTPNSHHYAPISIVKDTSQVSSRYN